MHLDLCAAFKPLDFNSLYQSKYRANWKNATAVGSIPIFETHHFDTVYRIGAPNRTILTQ